MSWSIFRVSFFIVLGLVISATTIFLAQCSKSSSGDPVAVPEPPLFASEKAGEDFLVAALDEIEFLSDAPLNGISPGLSLSSLHLLAKVSADSVYVYGEVDADGIGSVVTERRAYPKGMLLITVRKSHGGPGGRVVTETRRYTSTAAYLQDRPQQTNLTELYCPSSDTIVTHVLRNGVLDTYTFRLPVVTRVVDPGDGSVKVTTRYGLNGAVASEITDGAGTFVQRRLSNGLSDGSVITRSEYADSTWRSTRTLGLADGTVFREVTSNY